MAKKAKLKLLTAFTKAGAVKVEAVSGGNKNVVNYTVTDAKAKKKAKNVILFVGDGMSLQAREMARILSKGLSDGKYNDLLNMEKMPHMAVIPPTAHLLMQPAINPLTTLWAYMPTAPKTHLMTRK